jgi:ADP-heptose:LPS heptosyltransferase
VQRIAVFRALVLGDLLCATPALRALRHGIPGAQITLIGLPWAAALAERLDSVDDFIEFPGHPGLPERSCDPRDLPRFLDTVQDRRFDLAVQLHGSGPIVNPLVRLFGARRMAAFFNDQAWKPDGAEDVCIPWPEQGHEILRLLALTDALGLPRQGLHMDFPLRHQDHEDLRRAWPEVDDTTPYVCVHPGAQLPSRRWPADRFAAVADAIALSGRRVVLTGTESEAPLVAAVRDAMHQPAADLSGRTTLWTLGALVSRAEAVMSNDTGIAHVAAALRVPNVAVSSGADVSRWAPLDRERHQVLWADVPCRPCAHRDCPVGHVCATAIEPAQVMASLGRHLPQARTLTS